MDQLIIVIRVIRHIGLALLKKFIWDGIYYWAVKYRLFVEINQLFIVSYCMVVVLLWTCEGSL